jgi:predicted transcriptional regulator
MRRGRVRQLGDLERAVMNALWDSPSELTVRDIAAKFPNSAYTTILTVCDRLAKKELVVRRLEGRSHVYRPTASRDDFIVERVRDVLDSARDADSALIQFVAALDDEELRVVRRAIERRVAD